MDIEELAMLATKCSVGNNGVRSHASPSILDKFFRNETARVDGENGPSTELRGRIYKWLEESQLPDNASRGSSGDSSSTDEDCNQPVYILYHPDFVEWGSVEIDKHNHRGPGLIDILEASISKILKLPSQVK